MKKLFLFILLALATISSYSRDAIVVSNINLRTEASIAASRKALIPQGAVVTIQDSTDGWYLVNYNGRVGFVNAAYLIQTNEESTDN